MAFPFSSENTMIDPRILRLETYPQAGGTRPSLAGTSSQLTCHRDKGIIEGDGLCQTVDLDGQGYSCGSSE